MLIATLSDPFFLSFLHFLLNCFFFIIICHIEEVEPIKTESIPTHPVSITQIQITHGDPITDRKSKFQAHFAEVHSMEDVESVLSQLKEDKKIANATHSIFLK